MARASDKAAQRERFKAAALDALDVGKGWTGPGRGGGSVVDAAIAEAVATTGERANVRAAVATRDPHRIQQASAALAARKAELRQGEAAGGQQRRQRPTIDDYLERLTQRQREDIEQSAWFRKLDERHQADVRRRLAVLEEIEQEAEYRVARDLEEQALLEEEDEDESSAWDDSGSDFEERLGELRADQLEAESDAVFGAWDETMSAEEALGIVEPGTREATLSEEAGWPDEEEGDE